MMKEIYAMCNRKKMHIGTVKYFSDNGEEFCLIESPYRFSQVCCIQFYIFRHKKRGCEKRIVPKKERPRVYNELKVFLSVIINL